MVLVTRLIIFYFSLKHQEKYLTNDTHSYHSTALAWIQAGSFSLSIEHLEIPETIRTPGYPLFLGIIYKIFGKSYKAVVLVQILLSILSIYFIYLIGTLIHKETTGLIMALAFSFDPVTISMNYKILSETLFLFFLILF